MIFLRVRDVFTYMHYLKKYLSERFKIFREYYQLNIHFGNEKKNDFLKFLTAYNLLKVSTILDFKNLIFKLLHKIKLLHKELHTHFYKTTFFIDSFILQRSFHCFFCYNTKKLPFPLHHL